MSSIVFVGPSLAREQAARIWDDGVSFREPAACGDVYRAACEGPDAIGLIDGYFDQRLAVWHKELLWALHRGVRVYGAASMGALRATELADFGMVGVGRVFDWFRNGALEDDDEVAIVHEPAARGYRPTSDAMVNIRATLEHAQQNGIIAEHTLAQLVNLGKAIFYPMRSYESLMAAAKGALSISDELNRLREWLRSPDHRIDQKRRDAELLLRQMKSDATQHGQAPGSAGGFGFAYTEAWHELTRRLQSAEQ